MATIDKYNLKASPQFPISGTEEITENFVLTASSTSEEGVITGTVTTGTSTPLEGATVKVFDSSDTPIAHAVTNPEGKYTISSIVKGSYKVTAAKDGYITPIVTPVTVAANRPTTVNFNLSVDPDATKNTVFGIIRAAGSLAPLSGATVNTYLAGTPPTLVSTTVTNSTGQYISPYLADGDYFFVANMPGYNQTTSGTTTLSGAEIASLDIPLTANAAENKGTVSGIITDSSTLQPIANAIVALYEIAGTTETLLKLTKTNGAGRYLFGSVAASNYLVKAFAQTVE